MNESLLIYVDRLRDGHKEKISESCSPDFLDIHEDNLACVAPVNFIGEAYLADQELILRLAVNTRISLPCKICSDDAFIDIVVRDLCIVEELCNVKHGFFDFTMPLREAILLEIPSFAECNNGHCGHREEIKQYMHHADSGEEKYHPFAELK